MFAKWNHILNYFISYQIYIIFRLVAHIRTNEKKVFLPNIFHLISVEKVLPIPSLFSIFLQPKPSISIFHAKSKMSNFAIINCLRLNGLFTLHKSYTFLEMSNLRRKSAVFSIETPVAVV